MYFLFLFVTWFYIGLFPFVPGTIASFSIYPIYNFIIYQFALSNIIVFIFFLITFILLFLAICFLNIIHKYSNILIAFDDKVIVIDEVIGQFLTFAFSYNFLNHISFFLSVKYNFGDNIVFLSFILGFFCFRFFDILKPFCIKKIDKNYRNMFCVVLDDILAAIFASCLIYIFYVVIRFIS